MCRFFEQATDAVALIVAMDRLRLDAQTRRRLLAELMFAPPAEVTCVHGYDIEEVAEVGHVVMGRQLDHDLRERLGELLPNQWDGHGGIRRAGRPRRTRVGLGSQPRKW